MKILKYYNPEQFVDDPIVMVFTEGAIQEYAENNFGRTLTQEELYNVWSTYIEQDSSICDLMHSTIIDSTDLKDLTKK